MQKHAGAFRPPAERIQDSHPRRQQRNAEQQHDHVAEKDHHGGKQITLACDVRLLRLQNVSRQRHVKRIRRAEQQIKPDEIAVPVPDEIAERKQADQDDGIQREKIRRERDEEIRLGSNDVPAFGRDLHFFDRSSEQPRPDGVRQFMAKNINPHRLGHEQKNHNPARRAGEDGNPDRVRAVTRAQHEPQRFCCAGANRQQQNGDDELDPLRHARKISHRATERTEENSRWPSARTSVFSVALWQKLFYSPAMTQNEVLQIFRDSGALLEGHFILRSGLHSRQFFQCALALQQMPAVEKLGAALAAKVKSLGAVTVVAPAMGGLVIGQEVARQLGVRFIFVEKEEGKLVLRRGFKISAGEKILVVEDVVTKGGRVQETIEIVRAHGGDVVGVAMVVDRSNGQTQLGVPQFSLIALQVEAFDPNHLPPDLQKIPAVKPGSK